MYKYILLDLDGTIVDSGPGIRNSVEYALKKFGIEVEDKSQLNKFIGPPLKHSFMNFYGMDDENSDLAIKYYREYYAVTGIFECIVYDGIRELLEKLSGEGKKIVLATSKPQIFAAQVLEHFDLDKYFNCQVGQDMNDFKGGKDAIVQRALKLMDVKDPKEAVMVGDRMHDIVGAAANGVDCIAVLFGYGNREEFEEYGAKYIAADAEEIYRICNGEN